MITHLRLHLRRSLKDPLRLQVVTKDCSCITSSTYPMSHFTAVVSPESRVSPDVFECCIDKTPHRIPSIAIMITSTATTTTDTTTNNTLKTTGIYGIVFT